MFCRNLSRAKAQRPLTSFGYNGCSASVTFLSSSPFTHFFLQSLVKGKKWLAAIDGRERESHRAAHNRYQKNPIALGEEFIVGNGRGPAPGQIGLAEEDIQCRCTMQPVIED
jgi:hypothetical protein